MAHHRPKVSIIVPIYNSETYLEECLDSIINQTLKEIEIICVNDGSTDNSLDILNRYAPNDDRITIINKQNTGYGNSMNVGIDHAKGEYIGIVESDDYIKPHMYETLYNKAIEHDLDLIRADFEQFMGEGSNRVFKYIPLSKDKSYYNKILNPSENIKIFTFPMNNWSGIYKTEFIRKNQIRHNETPGASYQDNGFWFQTFCLAKRVYFLNTPLYQVRRDNPNSSVKSKEKVFCACEEYDYIRSFLDRNPDLKEKFLYIYSLKRFHNYMFTLERIADEFKLMFLKRFSDDFRKALEAGELDKELFPYQDWQKLMLIIDDPEKYYKEYKAAKEKRLNQKLPEDTRAIPQLFKKTLYYLKEYGVKSTLIKIKEKITRK